MIYKLKNIIYFVLIYSVTTINYVEARSKHTITCGNGKTVKVPDSQASNAAKVCLRAGLPAPKNKADLTLKRGMLKSRQQAANAGSEWDPNSARLPKGKKKLKSTCKYDENSAVLPTAPCKDEKPVSLLLPAVQAAREASCGSGSSVANALDQCGRKGHKFAACKKNNGNWTCSPSKSKNGENVRPTGMVIRR